MSLIAVQSVLFLSAFTPAMIFISLALEKYTYPDLQSESGIHINDFAIALEREIEKHFKGRLGKTVRMTREGDYLEGYFEALQNGEFIFYKKKTQQELMRLKKNHLGWALVSIAAGEEHHRKFIMPLILHLETRLFN